MAHTILIGCDQGYYDQWATNLLRSINKYAPWVKLHCHVVNPRDLAELPYVTYSTEEFKDPPLGYLEAVRFKVAHELYPNDELIILDADCICRRPFSQGDFDQLHQQGTTILRNTKNMRWLAGFVCPGNTAFLARLHQQLMSKPCEKWQSYWDQNCIKTVLRDMVAHELSPNWLRWNKIGKDDPVFYTIKGKDHKHEAKYKKSYDQALEALDAR